MTNRDKILILIIAILFIWLISAGVSNRSNRRELRSLKSENVSLRDSIWDRKLEILEAKNKIKTYEEIIDHIDIDAIPDSQQDSLIRDFFDRFPELR